MNYDLIPYAVIAGSIVAGLFWGRISSRLPIPEWLRLLSTFFWTGGLAIVAMFVMFVAMRSWTSPRVVDAAALGFAPLVRLVVGEACLWFLAGAGLGLPATLGWVVTYRQPAGG